jgi:hypothetical protein
MTRWEVTLEIKLGKPLPSVANLREHWRVRKERVDAQRQLVAFHLRTTGRTFLNEWRVISGNPAARLGVTFTRISPRELDSDNNVSAFKNIRDQLAVECGLNDRSPRYEWQYRQERGPAGYRIRLEILTHERAA